MRRTIMLVILSFCIMCSFFIVLIYVYKNGKDKQLEDTQDEVVEEFKIEDIKVENENNTHNKLMIVAHPDDETIFGGAHLIEDDYTVVCVTCGVVDYRLDEYKKVLETSNDKYVYLSHTDLRKNNTVSDWENGEKEEIKQELEKIINLREWEMIVTHNPDGEYGHKHHKMIDVMVTDLVTDKDKLYYFGKFYKSNVVNDMPVLDKELYKKKKELLDLYVSQLACTDQSSFYYMFQHENWVKYSDWK